MNYPTESELAEREADSLAASYRPPYIDPRDPRAEESELAERRFEYDRRNPESCESIDYFGQERRVRDRRFVEVAHPGAEQPMPARLLEVA